MANNSWVTADELSVSRNGGTINISFHYGGWADDGQGLGFGKTRIKVDGSVVQTVTSNNSCSGTYSTTVSTYAGGTKTFTVTCEGAYPKSEDWNQVASTSITASWDAGGSFTVYFNSNGGGKPSKTQMSVTNGSTYGQLALCARTGYLFLGWFDDIEDGTQITPSTPVNLTANQTLYAHWSAGAFTVIFDANGGTTPTESTLVRYDSTYGDLPLPTRPGYKFLGWFDSVEGGTQITSSTTVKITDTQTLYAHWEVMTIFRRVQNGSMEMYPLVFIKEGNNVSQATGLYIVENGTGYTCV